MGQLKAKTMIERAGFKDDDLKTPEHDSIMIWLDKNIEEVLALAFPKEWSSRETEEPQNELLSELAKRRTTINSQINQLYSKIERIEDVKSKKISLGNEWDPKFDDDITALESKISEATSQIETISGWISLEQPPLRPTPTVTLKQWEFPIVNGRDFVVGFVDMMVRIQKPFLWIKFHCTNDNDPISDKPEWEITSHSSDVYFEVKSKISSLGELIRQIRFYQSHKQGLYFVVSPDERYADVLRSQGIGFIACPSFSSKATQATLF